MNPNSRKVIAAITFIIGIILIGLVLYPHDFAPVYC